MFKPAKRVMRQRYEFDTKDVDLDTILVVVSNGITLIDDLYSIELSDSSATITVNEVATRQHLDGGVNTVKIHYTPLTKKKR
jgi:hypothetical protein